RRSRANHRGLAPQSWNQPVTRLVGAVARPADAVAAPAAAAYAGIDSGSAEFPSRGGQTVCHARHPRGNSLEGPEAATAKNGQSSPLRRRVPGRAAAPEGPLRAWSQLAIPVCRKASYTTIDTALARFRLRTPASRIGMR